MHRLGHLPAKTASGKLSTMYKLYTPLPKSRPMAATAARRSSPEHPSAVIFATSRSLTGARRLRTNLFHSCWRKCPPRKGKLYEVHLRKRSMGRVPMCPNMTSALFIFFFVRDIYAVCSPIGLPPYHHTAISAVCVRARACSAFALLQLIQS